MKRTKQQSRKIGVLFEIGLLGTSVKWDDGRIEHWQIAQFGKSIGKCLHCGDTHPEASTNYGLFCKTNADYQTPPIALCSTCYSMFSWRETVGRVFASGNFNQGPHFAD